MQTLAKSLSKAQAAIVAAALEIGAPGEVAAITWPPPPANPTVDISHGDAESVRGGDFVRGFASGGRPTPGEVVLVGEHGPDLFVADQPGTVLPGFGSLAPAAPWHWWDGIPGTPAAPTVAAPQPNVIPVPGTPGMPGYVAPGSLNFSPGRDRTGATQ